MASSNISPSLMSTPSSSPQIRSLVAQLKAAPSEQGEGEEAESQVAQLSGAAKLRAAAAESLTQAHSLDPGPSEKVQEFRDGLENILGEFEKAQKYVVETDERTRKHRKIQSVRRKNIHLEDQERCIPNILSVLTTNFVPDETQISEEGPQCLSQMPESKREEYRRLKTTFLELVRKHIYFSLPDIHHYCDRALSRIQSLIYQECLESEKQLKFTTRDLKDELKSIIQRKKESNSREISELQQELKPFELSSISTAIMKESKRHVLKHFAGLWSVEAEDIQYLRLEDLDWREDILPALQNVPDDYSDVAIPVVRALVKGELGNFLFNVSLSHEDYREEGAEEKFLLGLDATTIISGLRAPFYKDGYGRSRCGGRVIHYKDKSGIEMENVAVTGASEREGRRAIYIGRSLKHECKNGVAFRSTVSLPGAKEFRFVRSTCTNKNGQFSECIWIFSELDFSGSTLSHSRLDQCAGSIESSKLNDCEIIAGEKPLSINNSMIANGSLQLNTQITCSRTFFMGTKLDCDSSKGSEGTLFRSCDFSLAVIEKEALNWIALHSQNCFFSPAQRKVIGLRNCKKMNAQSSFVLNKNLLASLESPQKKGMLIPSEGLGVFGTRTDLLAIEGLAHMRPDGPFIRVGEPQESPHDLRSIFPALTRKGAERLKERRDFIDFLKRKLQDHEGEDPKLGVWLQWFKEYGMEKACAITGLPPEIASISVEGIAQFPFHFDGKSVHYQRWDEKNGECSEKYAEFSNDINLETEKGRLTPASLLYLFSMRMERAVGFLAQYLRREQTLCDDFGFTLPERTEEETGLLEVEGFFTAGLIGSMGYAEIGKTEFLLLDTNKAQVISLCGLNKEAGKTTFGEGLVQLFRAIQSGEPAAASRVFQGPDAMIDHIVRMPNPPPGANESGAEERVLTAQKVIRDLRERADPNSPKKVVVLIDEFVKGTMSHHNAVNFERSIVSEILNIKGLIPIIILSTAEAGSVVTQLQELHPGVVRVFQGSHGNFIETDSPVDSEPDTVIETTGAHDLFLSIEQVRERVRDV
jgi:hypothetical protein